MASIYKKTINVLLIILIILLTGYYLLRITNVINIYAVKSGSMEKSIHVGDYILVMKKSDYKVGDIVSYKEEDHFVTHRIVTEENDTYITKGDANNAEDKPISKNSVVGKVILSGGIINFVVNYKFVLAAIFITLYLLSCYLNDNKKETKDKE